MLLRPARALAPTALLAAWIFVLAACSTTPSRADDAETGGLLRVGPLDTQNTLTLAVDGGPLEDAVAGARGTLALASRFPAFAPAAEAMAAGHVDMTTGSSTALIAALGSGSDAVVFAVEHNDGDTQGIVARPGSGIESVRDLAGRSVAVNKGGTGDYLLRQALAREGMSIGDVEPVYLGPPDAASAFAAGQVDAWATWDQYLAFAHTLEGSTPVALARDIGATNRTVHVVSRGLLDAHPELVRAAYKALEQQAAAVRADPGLLGDAYVAAGATRQVADLIAARTPPRIVAADDAFHAELQAVADFYAAQGLTPSVVDVTGAVVDVQRLP